MYVLRQIKKTVAALLLVSVSSQMVGAMPFHQVTPAEVLFFNPLKVGGAKALLASYNNISFVPKVLSGVVQTVSGPQRDQILSELTLSAVAGAVVGSLSFAIGGPVIAEPLVGALMASGNSRFAERVLVGGVSTEVMRFVLGQRPLTQVLLELLTNKEGLSADAWTASAELWFGNTETFDVLKGSLEGSWTALSRYTRSSQGGEDNEAANLIRVQAGFLGGIKDATLPEAAKKAYKEIAMGESSRVWGRHAFEKVRLQIVSIGSAAKDFVSSKAAALLATVTAAGASGFAAIMAVDREVGSSATSPSTSSSISSSTSSDLKRNSFQDQSFLSLVKPSVVVLKDFYDQNQGRVSQVAIALKEAADENKAVVLGGATAFKKAIDNMGGTRRAALSVGTVMVAAAMTGQFFAWGMWSVVTFLAAPVMTAAIKAKIGPVARE